MPKGDRGGKLNTYNSRNHIMENRTGKSNGQVFNGFNQKRIRVIENELGLKIYPSWVKMTSNRVQHARHHVTAGDQLSVDEVNRALSAGRLFHDLKYPGSFVTIQKMTDSSGNEYGAYVVLGIMERYADQSAYIRVRNAYAISNKDADKIFNEESQGKEKRRYIEFKHKDY